jgi:excisionase family DNA binding protein
MAPHEYGLTKACYSVNETLTLLSIGRTSLYQLVQRGDLHPAKLGTKTLFYASDLAALLTKLREPKSRTPDPAPTGPAIPAHP